MNQQVTLLAGQGYSMPAAGPGRAVPVPATAAAGLETPLGAVRFKIAYRNGRAVNAVPEFEDCARIAAAHNVSVKEVQAIALRAYQP